jgi:N-acetylneuraminic acid mutarotase
MSRRILIIIIAGCQIVLSTAQSTNGNSPQPDSSTALATISEGPALPGGRGSHAGAVISGRVVVVGGTAWSDDRTKKSFLSDSLIFDKGSWEPGPSLPHAVAEGAFASDDHHLYLVGGLNGVDKASVDVFELAFDDASQLRVNSLPALPIAQFAGAAAVLDGRLYVAGGYVDGQVTKRCWALDLNRREHGWMEIEPISAEPRAYSVLTAFPEKLYLLGGMTPVKDSMRVFKDVLEYDPGSGTWRKVGDLPVSGYCWSSIPIDTPGELLVGGRADGQIHDDLWLVDLRNLAVRSAGSSVITTTCAPLVHVAPDKYWLIGGEPNSNMTRTPLVTEIQLKSNSR